MTLHRPDKKVQLIRDIAESDLEAFIHLVHPNRVLGQVHKDLIQWWNRQDAKSHQLVLLPRDHMKSALAAYRVAWEITRNPAIRILYISNTANLATKQLKFIKDILTCDTYRKYWPEMVNEDESKREKWTETEISVDHPLRKKEIIRDPTVFVAGLTTSVVGLHSDINVLDDVVTDDNAYSEDGRKKVLQQISYLASIGGTDSRQWVVGTRYHPKDAYQTMMDTVVEEYDNEGNIVDSHSLYEIYEAKVETNGEFLWPRMQRQDGKWFGFNASILAKKKAQYSDFSKFRAQYYNDPNDPSSSAIARETFQYFDRTHLEQSDGRWYLKGRRLNVFAAIDFAYSTKKEADYTCLVVVGIDSNNNYYVLDIKRFKTNIISDYFRAILETYVKWGYRKLRAEVNGAQLAIVKDLKENYIKKHGLALAVEDYRPNNHMGRKEERIAACLNGRYQNRQMWHYKGGNTELLEEELEKQNPVHDDIKDALASCVEICIPPSSMSSKEKTVTKVSFNKRFGGVGIYVTACLPLLQYFLQLFYSSESLLF